MTTSLPMQKKVRSRNIVQVCKNKSQVVNVESSQTTGTRERSFATHHQWVHVQQDVTHPTQPTASISFSKRNSTEASQFLEFMASCHLGPVKHTGPMLPSKALSIPSRMPMATRHLGQHVGRHLLKPPSGAF